MNVTKVQGISFTPVNAVINRPYEVREYRDGDYTLTVELFSDKQIRTIRSIKKGEVISQETINILA